MFSPTVWWSNIQPPTEGRVRGQILHGSARTTEAVRRAIQHSEEGLKVLATRYGINEKTVLMKEEEAICVAFRKHTLLPLDDCL